MTGKSAKYILHNHPNNSSFSLNDISYLVQNKPEFISLVTNTGKVELLELNEDFNKATLNVKFKRLKKKYNKDIANNKKKGYTKIAENLLNDKSLGFTLRI